MDREPPLERNKGKDLHDTMEKHAMFDTFRIINKNKKKFTHEQPIQLTDQKTKSKIDYIYTD